MNASKTNQNPLSQDMNATKPNQNPPSQEDMATALLQIKNYLRPLLLQRNFEVSEIEEAEALLKKMNEAMAAKAPIDDTDNQKIAEIYPKIKRLAELGENYHTQQRATDNKGRKQFNTSILVLPSADGKKIVTHIAYPLFAPTGSSFFNPLGLTSLEIKAAASEAAKILGLNFKSDLLGKKIAAWNLDGSGLSREQNIAYYKLIAEGLKAKGLPAYVGDYWRDKATGLAEEAQSKIKLEQAPQVDKYLIKDNSIQAIDPATNKGIGRAEAFTTKLDPSVTLADGSKGILSKLGWNYEVKGDVLTLTSNANAPVPLTAVASALQGASKDSVEMMINAKGSELAPAAPVPPIPSTRPTDEETGSLTR